jgi:exopolysaccharide biosynthesis polyprenyl glycosylphosphotransferase
MATLESLSSQSFEPSLFVTHPNNPRRPAVAAVKRVPGSTLLAVAETAIALGAIGIVLIVANVAAMPDGLNSFLSIRVTVRNVLLLSAVATAWPAIFHLCGLYEAKVIRSATEERLRVIGACSIGSTVGLFLPMLSTGRGLAAVDLFYVSLLTIAGTLALRELRRRIVLGRRSRRRVLLVGSGLRAQRMWQSLSSDPAATYELAGLIDSRLHASASFGGNCPYLGGLDRLEQLLMHQAVDEVCIGLPIKSHYPQIQEAIRVCERVGVRTKYQADLFEREVAWPRYDEPGSPTVTLHVVPDDYRLAVKRVLDIVWAIAGVLVLSPVMLAAVIVIKATSPGVAIFAQERYGLNRRRFRMFKFRTMFADAEQQQAALEARNEADGPVFKMADDPRVTPVGRFLRRTSIDELPQLFNVLRGEMSLVGPRPLPLRDVTRFARSSDMRRFSVRPGLTGLWQVSGRSTLTFGDWIKFDLKYIDEWSLALDLLILLRTIPAVLRGRGAR